MSKTEVSVTEQGQISFLRYVRPENHQMSCLRDRRYALMALMVFGYILGIRRYEIKLSHWTQDLPLFMFAHLIQSRLYAFEGQEFRLSPEDVQLEATLATEFWGIEEALLTSEQCDLIRDLDIIGRDVSEYRDIVPQIGTATQPIWEEISELRYCATFKYDTFHYWVSEFGINVYQLVPWERSIPRATTIAQGPFVMKFVDFVSTNDIGIMVTDHKSKLNQSVLMRRSKYSGHHAFVWDVGLLSHSNGLLHVKIVCLLDADKTPSLAYLTSGFQCAFYFLFDTHDGLQNSVAASLTHDGQISMSKYLRNRPPKYEGRFLSTGETTLKLCVAFAAHFGMDEVSIRDDVSTSKCKIPLAVLRYIKKSGTSVGAELSFMKARGFKLDASNPTAKATELKFHGALRERASSQRISVTTVVPPRSDEEECEQMENLMVHLQPEWDAYSALWFVHTCQPEDFTTWAKEWI